MKKKINKKEQKYIGFNGFIYVGTSPTEKYKFYVTCFISNRKRAKKKKMMELIYYTTKLN